MSSSPPANSIPFSSFEKINHCEKCQIRHWPPSGCPLPCTSSASDCCFRINTDFGAPCDACSRLLPDTKDLFASAKDYDYPSDHKGNNSIYYYPLSLISFYSLRPCIVPSSQRSSSCCPYDFIFPSNDLKEPINLFRV